MSGKEGRKEGDVGRGRKETGMKEGIEGGKRGTRELVRGRREGGGEMAGGREGREGGGKERG